MVAIGVIQTTFWTTLMLMMYWCVVLVGYFNAIIALLVYITVTLWATASGYCSTTVLYVKKSIQDINRWVLPIADWERKEVGKFYGDKRQHVGIIVIWHRNPKKIIHVNSARGVYEWLIVQKQYFSSITISFGSFFLRTITITV